MKICKTCGEENSGDSKYCCNCGGTLFETCGEVICSECGAANDVKFAHCTNCGSLLHTEGQLTDVTAELDYSYGGVSAVVSDESAQCPSCGAKINLNTVFCTNCGASVADVNSHRVVRRKICPHCGKPNKTDIPYCTYCYSSLADAKIDEMQVVHQTVTSGVLTVKKAFLNGMSGKNVICNACGTLNAPDEHFCVSCGSKLEIERQVRYCPNCGSENPIGSNFCHKCQWSFDGASSASGEKWICHKCGKPNDIESKFCINCGTRSHGKEKR